MSDNECMLFEEANAKARAELVEKRIEELRGQTSQNHFDAACYFAAHAEPWGDFQELVGLIQGQNASAK